VQIERIRRAAQQVLLRSRIGLQAPLVAVGSGAFLVPELASQLHRPVITFAHLVDSCAELSALSMCAPAVAVAMLAQQTGR